VTDRSQKKRQTGRRYGDDATAAAASHVRRLRTISSRSPRVHASLSFVSVAVRPCRFLCSRSRVHISFPKSVRYRYPTHHRALACCACETAFVCAVFALIFRADGNERLRCSSHGGLVSREQRCATG